MGLFDTLFPGMGPAGGPINVNMQNTDQGGDSDAPWWDLDANPSAVPTTGAASTPFELALQRMGYELWGSTDPLRQAQTQRLMGMLTGSYDITKDPMFAQSFGLGKQAIDSQLGNAMDQILGTRARGGQMTSALGDLATQAMVQQANLPAMIAGDLLKDQLTQANQIAWQTPMAGIQALTGANTSFTDRLNQQSQNEQQDENNMWSFFGNLM